MIEVLRVEFRSCESNLKRVHNGLLLSRTRHVRGADRFVDLSRHVGPCQLTRRGIH